MKNKLFIFPVLSLVLLAAPAYAVGLGTSSSTTGTVGISGGGVNSGIGLGVGANANADTGMSSNASASGAVNGDIGDRRSRSVTSGTLSGTTYSRNESRLTPNMNARQFSVYAMNRWDLNGDGRVSKDEWSAINPAWFGDTRVSSFNSLDRNNNGVIDLDESQSIFTNEHFYEMYDVNHDGVIDNTESARIPAQ